ncbi:hypothetical protein B0H13DRAFT_1948608 [Mycena leptocephala]|nr:hypothetical protein B0H13DRAFT_1948608 [Mycena leptocephala]
MSSLWMGSSYGVKIVALVVLSSYSPPARLVRLFSAPTVESHLRPHGTLAHRHSDTPSLALGHPTPARHDAHRHRRNNAPTPTGTDAGKAPHHLFSLSASSVFRLGARLPPSLFDTLPSRHPTPARQLIPFTPSVRTSTISRAGARLPPSLFL